MSYNYGSLYAGFTKKAVAALTPEAMQAAQAPMPPQGVMPADPAAMGGAPPMDPATMGGMPPQGGAPADPAAGGMMGATGPRGGEVPPEILQDQQFLAFLEQMMGIVFDPQAGMFIDGQGQPVPVEMIMQAYQEFQVQMQAMEAQGGAAPAPGMEGGMPPVDPAMAGGAVPPEAAGMPAEGAVPPEAAGMPPMEGAAPEAAPAGGEELGVPEDPMAQMADVMVSAVETIVGEALSAQEKKISIILDKIDTLKKDIDSLLSSDNKRTKEEDEKEEDLRGELEKELASAGAAQPTAAPQPITEALPKAASVNKQSALSLFNLVTKRG